MKVSFQKQFLNPKWAVVMLLWFLFYKLSIAESPMTLYDQKPHEVTSSGYGMALYDFFQDDYFNALTQLMVDEQKETNANKPFSEKLHADALQANINIHYGLSKKIERMITDLENILSSELVPDMVEKKQAKTLYNQVCFYLGQFYYQQKNNQKSLHYFNKLKLNRSDLNEKRLANTIDYYFAMIDLKQSLQSTDTPIRAISLHEKRQVKTFQDDPLTIYLHHNLAIHAALRGDYQRALDLWKRLSIDKLPTKEQFFLKDYIIRAEQQVIDTVNQREPLGLHSLYPVKNIKLGIAELDRIILSIRKHIQSTETSDMSVWLNHYLEAQDAEKKSALLVDPSQSLSIKPLEDPRFLTWHHQWQQISQIEQRITQWQNKMPLFGDIIDSRDRLHQNLVKTISNNPHEIQQSLQQLKSRQLQLLQTYHTLPDHHFAWSKPDTRNSLKRYQSALEKLGSLKSSGYLSQSETQHYDNRLNTILGRLIWRQYEESLTLRPEAYYQLKAIEKINQQSTLTANHINQLIIEPEITRSIQNEIITKTETLNVSHQQLKLIQQKIIGRLMLALEHLKITALHQKHQWLAETLYHKAVIADQQFQNAQILQTVQTADTTDTQPVKMLELIIEYYRDAKDTPLIAMDQPVNVNWYNLRKNHLLFRLAQLEIQLAEEYLVTDQSSGALFNSAQTHLTRWINAFPQDALQPEAWYLLAKSHAMQGQVSESIASLEHFYQHYPQHTFYHEAAFRLAEHAYTKENYVEAFTYYQATLSAPKDHPLYVNALYMNGWSLFKDNQYKQAFVYFDKTLDHLEKTQTDTADSIEPRETTFQQGILSDTYRISAVIASYQNSTPFLIDYYQSTELPNHGTQVFQSLSDYYQSNERWNDTLAVHQAFQQQYPFHKQSPHFQRQSIDLLTELKLYGDAHSAKADYVARFGPESDYWQQAKETDRTAIKPTLHAYLGGLAETSYAKAQKQATTHSDWQDTLQYYQMLITHFPEHPDHLTHRFLLADAYFESEQYQRSIELYEPLAYPNQGAEPPEPSLPSEQQQTAAYALLSAHQRLVTNTSSEIQQKKMLAEELRFITQFPDHPETPALLTHAATSAFTLGQVEQAVTLSKQILNQPNADQKQAYSILADTHFNNKDFTEAKTYYMAAIRAFPNASEAAIWQQQLINSLYRQGTQLFEAELWQQAANEWLQIPTIDPTHELSVPALLNTAEAWQKMEQWEAAIKQLNDIRTQYPEHPSTKNIPLELISLHESQENWRKTADEYFLIYQNPSQPKNTRKNALWNAALNYQKLSISEETRALTALCYEQYLTEFDIALDEKSYAQKQLADLFKHQPATRLYWLNALITTDSEANPTTPISRQYAIEAALEIAANQQNTFNQIPLTLPLEKSFSIKQASMEEAIQSLQRVMAYQETHSYHQAQLALGNLYYQFSQDLYQSEKPAGLNELELEQYLLLLEEEAYPFEEKAIALWEENFQRVWQGEFDASIPDTLLQLKKVIPGQYNRPEKRSPISAYWY